jgi:hypothetical protein
MEISCNELHERSLPSSTGSDKCCLLSSLDGEGEVIEYLGFIVAVGDILNFDVFGSFRKSRTRIVSLHNWTIIEHFPELLDIRKIFGKILIKFCRIKEK